MDFGCGAKGDFSAFLVVGLGALASLNVLAPCSSLCCTCGVSCEGAFLVPAPRAPAGFDRLPSCVIPCFCGAGADLAAGLGGALARFRLPVPCPFA